MYRHLGYKRVYLSLYKVADTPFHIQGGGIYNIVNLLHSCDNMHSVTYITKIMLTGIAIKITGYYDNINGCYLK